MTKNWDIGREARELDEKSIIERMKIEKRTIAKLLMLSAAYFIAIILLSFIL